DAVVLRKLPFHRNRAQHRLQHIFLQRNSFHFAIRNFAKYNSAASSANASVVNQGIHIQPLPTFSACRAGLGSFSIADKKRSRERAGGLGPVVLSASN